MWSTASKARETYCVDMKLTYVSSYWLCLLGWLEKNNDKLSDDYEKVFATSSKELVASQLARREEEPEAEGGRARQRKGKGSQTVGRGFLTSLKRLMEALEMTEAHFIR